MRIVRTSQPIPLSKPFLDKKDEERARAAIRSGWLTQSGSEVKLMEGTLQNYYCQKTNQPDFICKSASNGTTALHLALLSIGIEEGDEVVIPNFAYAAVANSVLYCNATPVLVDVNFDTWNLDVDLVLQAITKKTKAIILVDNYGIEADYLKLRSLLDDRIIIIRDACESFPFMGSHYPLFSGDLITNSFFANKIITSGEGGSIFGPSHLLDKITILRNQGVENPGNFQHSMLGYNYRISNLHAAIFNSQWERLETLKSKRTEIFAKYNEFFSKHFPNSRTNAHATPWLFTVNFSGVAVPRLRSFLKIHQIETRPGFTPFHKFPYLIKYGKPHYLISESLSANIISFPTFPELSEKDIAHIMKTTMKFQSEYTE